MGIIEKVEGRSLFGNDPERYDNARPPYPPQVFALLEEHCGLRAGARVLEIGPGTGNGTRELLRRGAIVTAVEADPRLAAFLVNRTNAGIALQVITAAFENVDIPDDTFDLVASASAFHWLDEMISLHKIAGILKQGGYWAVWWNLFFQDSRTDELYRATSSLFRDLGRAPSAAAEDHPSFALDTESRIASLEATKKFCKIFTTMISWTMTLDTGQIRRLYSTFSPISRLDEQERGHLLDRLAEIVNQDFGGEAQIDINTPFYAAQCRK